MTEEKTAIAEGKAGEEIKAGFWRYAAIWLSLCLGLALALALLGMTTQLKSPFAPLALTMGTVSCIGMSSFCLWGLLFSIPMYYLAVAWLKGGCWWRILPAILFLQGILCSLNLTFMGTRTPDNSLFKAPKEALTGDAAEAELAQLADEASARWGEGLTAAGICVALLALHIMICGPKSSWLAFKARWDAVRAWLKQMREQSKAEEEAKKQMKAQESAAMENQQDSK